MEKAESLKIIKAIISYEPYEQQRPFFNLNESFKRSIVGQRLANLTNALGLSKSYRFEKYIKKNIQSFLRSFVIIKSAIVSYVNPLFIVTTYESSLFGLFSKKTTFLQNFSEIWDEIDKKSNNSSRITSFLLNKYYANTNYLVAPQEDRLVLASTRYTNSKGYLIHNVPRLADFKKWAIATDKKRILYQGRVSDDSLGGKILDLVDSLPDEVEFHLAGLVNKNYVKRVAALNESGKLIYHGYLDWQSLDELRKTCNIGLVSWSDNTLNTKFCAPNKLYEYIASGMYVVCFNNYSLIKLNKQFDFGFVCGSPKELAEHINKLSMECLIQKGEKNVQLFLKELNYENQTKQLFSDLVKVS
ncbi:MAG: glycosyltransferase [Alphaproteobacteria bacterium]|nr:glycosyltransferase [Alphaproteobacteria bacterium]